MQSDVNVISYQRISTLNQLDGAGLETQQAKVVDFCKVKGWRLVKTYQDIGSGTIKNREGVMRMLSDCSKGDIAKVLVYRRDRLARDLFVALWIEKELRKYNVELISVTEPHADPTTPIGKAFANLIAIFAELECDIITFRLSDGRQHAARQGRKASGSIPFGFRKQGKSLKVNEAESSWVVKAYRWKAQGCSYSFIVKQFNRAGLTTRRGKPFQCESIKYLLRNKLYYGEMDYGNITGIKAASDGIITKRLFFKAQRAMQEKSYIAS